MNLPLKFELLKEFGSQLNAAKHFGITEPRLSHIVCGHTEPSPAEMAIFAKQLGAGKVQKLFRKRKQSSTGSRKLGVAHREYQQTEVDS